MTPVILELGGTDGFDMAELCSMKPERYPAAFVSTASSGPNSRYDILFACPQHQIWSDAKGQTSIDGEPATLGFLDALDAQRSLHANPCSDDAGLPFINGWLVFLAYELAAEIEPTLDLPVDDSGFPRAVAWRCPAAVIHDHERHVFIIAAEPGSEAIIEHIRGDIDACMRSPKSDVDSPVALDVKEADPAPYFEQLARVKQYIVDGDVFQVNLSRPWEVVIEAVDDAVLFDRLADANPGSFAAIMKLPLHTILSSSPERLVRVRDGHIETRPIAGTRPRSEDHEEDLGLSDELLAHPKERAEHVMLIDLERNDLGRVCVPGSVSVDEMMVLESYRHVHHIVSNVSGELRSDVGIGDIIRAVFPGGTITGCPKVRCMEILAELEQTPRGAYTGSMGYIGDDGSMDINILIRTMVRHDDEISFRAGGGIVADSDAEHELQETRAKARGLLKVFAT